MSPVLALWLAGVAGAASLDNLEVGGTWGTPTSTDATAVFWNPAGLAAQRGHRFVIEGAPTFATVTFVRDDPYNGGTDGYKLAGVVPFAGFATDLGVDGLGLGLSLSVPFVRGGREMSEPGPGSFHMREGESKAVFLTGAAAWQFADRVSIGASVSMVESSWSANLDNELTTSLDEQISDLGQDSGYTDAQIESRDYAAELTFHDLKDRTFTFGVGGRYDIHERVAVALTYVHGARVENTGDVTLAFGCPPQEDTLGRFGAEAYGLCNSTLNAHGRIGYVLPPRLHGGIEIRPTDTITLRPMAGFVWWSRYQDFDITVENVEDLNDLDNENSADLVNQHRLWARANENALWAGIDGKVLIGKGGTLGGRVTYDQAAVPDEALSPNNYDADAWMVGLMGAYAPVRPIEIGVSITHHFLTTRVIDNSAFLVTLDEASRPEDRWFYPQMNGTYSGVIDRIGLSVRGTFGGNEAFEE